MSLTPGARLGSYEILGLLGAGGMGEVYRARDTRLQRQVALKVLSGPFALNPDRLARFEREAQLLASLNHPNIADIHGVEEANGIRALVLELVEGPTLAERLAHGPIPLIDALSIARQVVDAVDAAHQQGVVHRDLKPGNIKLRPDGTVKVLDFGLAKLVEGPAEAGRSTDLTASPTVASPAMTEIGVILGTAAYMSPEQARGLVVDKGTDIWAFGCVLFEMFSGARAFRGDDVTETMAAIVRGEPEWPRLPAATPESVRRLIRRCLEKDRKRRLADIRDARFELEEGETAPAAPAVVAARGRRRERMAWSAAVAILTVIAGVALALSRTKGSPSRPSEIRVDIATPPTTDPVSFAISPDGEHIVFVASSNGQPRLWLRSMSTGTARPMPGTQGASFPFWSPDSRSVGFFSTERLQRIDVDGGSPTALTFAPVGAGGAWNGDGVILFPPVPDAPLLRVSDHGGEATPVPGFQPGGGERYPQWLPDRRHFLYYVAESRGVFLGDLKGAERRRLLDADAAAVFAAPGQLLFVRDATLFTQDFNVDTLEVVGNRSPLAEGVAVDRSRGMAAVSASSVGSLLYRTGAFDQRRQLVWVDRQGNEREKIGDPDPAGPANPVLSPDGTRVALSRSRDGNTDIWLHELGRDGFSRFTFDPLPEIVPIWSPDGTQILFAKAGGSAAGLFLKSVTDAGAGEKPLVNAPGPTPLAIPLDWSRDGRFVIFRIRDPKNGWDIWAQDLAGTRQPFPIVQTPFDERTAQLSRDSRWMVYESNDSGRFEIYLQPFPGGARLPVSTTGGAQPRWRADDREIFYIAADGYLMAVSVRPPNSDQSTVGHRIELGAPVRLFQTRVESTVQGGITHSYVASQDGQRFLMTTFIEQVGRPLTLVLNRSAR